MDQVDEKHAQDFEPLYEQKQAMRDNHRKERAMLNQKQQERWAQETKERSARLNKGIKGLWQSLSGSAFNIKQQNEREAWSSLQRDQEQRDDLVKAQMQDRRILQKDIENLRRKHAQNRSILYREISQSIRMSEQTEKIQTQERRRTVDRHYRGPSL